MILYRYLRRELFQYWLVISLVLWLVLVAARLSLYLGQAASGLLPANVVLELLALKSVAFFVFLLPLTLFLALLWLLGRLNRDFESAALAATGVGLWQLYRAVAPLVVAVTLLLAALSLYLVPYTAQEGYKVRARAEYHLHIESLQPGQFHKIRNGRGLLFAQRAGSEANSLESVFIYMQHPEYPQVLVAARAYVRQTAANSARYLVLENGYRYHGVPGRSNYQVLRYQEYALRLQAAPITPTQKWDAVPTRALWDDPSLAARAELHTRLSRPVTVLVLVLIGISLARFRPGVSAYTPLWMGVLLFSVYFNLLAVGRLWLEHARVPDWLGLWWVHALLLSALFGARLVGRWRPWRQVSP